MGASHSRKNSQPGTAAGTTSAFTELFGDKLLSSSGRAEATAELLAGKSAVAIYFSAHWCPPCRGFTPALAKAYNEHLKNAGLEIVFVSSDQNDNAFQSYFSEMPWLALPYSEAGLKTKLAKKYGVSGIPKLVLLDSAGKLITGEARAKVTSDPTGASWLPAPPKPTPPPKTEPTTNAPTAQGGLSSVFGFMTLLDTDGKTAVSLTEVVKEAPLVGLYFSAHWCGPCRRFTPELVAFKQQLAAKGVRLPIIFASSDKDEASFQEYFGTMEGFHALPFKDARIGALNKKYETQGIPWLVVLDANGNLVANEADTEVSSMGAAAYDHWLKQVKGATAAAGAPAA